MPMEAEVVSCVILRDRFARRRSVVRVRCYIVVQESLQLLETMREASIVKGVNRSSFVVE